MRFTDVRPRDAQPNNRLSRHPFPTPGLQRGLDPGDDRANIILAIRAGEAPPAPGDGKNLQSALALGHWIGV